MISEVMDLLIVHKLVEPCAETKAILDAVGSVRIVSLSNIPNIKGYCAWDRKKLKGRQQRWCGQDCVHTAMHFCAPQNPAPKMARLIFKQDCSCKGCGLNYEDQIVETIKRKYERNKSFIKSPTYSKMFGDDDPRVTLHQLGYGTGHIWQTDHIIPITDGGKGIDPNNLQVLCVDCHKRKTAEEHSERSQKN
jgi:5-methylcytosine-specific restriction endonuclease McrA